MLINFCVGSICDLVCIIFSFFISCVFFMEIFSFVFFSYELYIQTLVLYYVHFDLCMITDISYDIVVHDFLLFYFVFVVCDPRFRNIV